jgi:Zn-finger nucleic acid-binding protein
MHAALAKIRILYCTKCRGMLIPMAVLEGLIEEQRVLEGGTFIQPAADDRDSRRRINCPHCHKLMDAHRYAGPGNVYIDSCEGCLLIWLDRGELTRMVHAPDEAAKGS